LGDTLDRVLAQAVAFAVGAATAHPGRPWWWGPRRRPWPCSRSPASVRSLWRSQVPAAGLAAPWPRSLGDPQTPKNWGLIQSWIRPQNRLLAKIKPT